MCTTLSPQKSSVPPQRDSWNFRRASSPSQPSRIEWSRKSSAPIDLDAPGAATGRTARRRGRSRRETSVIWFGVTRVPARRRLTASEILRSKCRDMKPSVSLTRPCSRKRSARGRSAAEATATPTEAPAVAPAGELLQVLHVRRRRSRAGAPRPAGRSERAPRRCPRARARRPATRRRRRRGRSPRAAPRARSAGSSGGRGGRFPAGCRVRRGRPAPGRARRSSPRAGADGALGRQRLAAAAVGLPGQREDVGAERGLGEVVAARARALRSRRETP